jgi:hypothetical protein
MTIAEKPENGLIALEDARLLLPVLPDGSRPTTRWVSEEARRLGCYRKMGKGAFIERAAWKHFVWGIPWRPTPDGEPPISALHEALALSSGRGAADYGYVYFVDGGHLTKIGFSTSPPTKRVASLQTGSPIKCVLWGYARGGFDLERILHKRFGHCRRDGEWFDLSPYDRAALASLARRTKGTVFPSKMEG